MQPTTTLIVLDGWGYRDDAKFNAIRQGNTPTWDRLWRECPHALLECSGKYVGLPDGQMGNSEVGHLTIGAGRVIPQDLKRIDDSIADGSFEQNAAIRALGDESNTGVLHVFGLLSPGGVHSHEDHIFAAISSALDAERRVALHAFLDGRDTPPQSAERSLQRAMRLQEQAPRFTLASISGRYYAMDRDQRWDRTKQAYDLYVHGSSTFSAPDGVAGLNSAYERGETDEFVVPTKIGEGTVVRDGDDALFMNFRADRVRQLCRAFTIADADFPFPRDQPPKLNRLVCLTPYADDINAAHALIKRVDVAFEAQDVHDTFGAVVSNAEKSQLRIAETEKYAHVTYFFSGGSEQALPGESRSFIPSPKVATYDLQPTMSAVEVTTEVENAIRESKYDAIVCNLANADMVGHTGNFKAAVAAVECIDACLARISQATRDTDSHCVVTADHGNAEEMVDPTSEQPHTAHTVGLVPFVYIGRSATACEPRGSLQDVAPTLLKLMNIEPPSAMTGQPLLR